MLLCFFYDENFPAIRFCSLLPGSLNNMPGTYFQAKTAAGYAGKVH